MNPLIEIAIVALCGSLLFVGGVWTGLWIARWAAAQRPSTQLPEPKVLPLPRGAARTEPKTEVHL